MEAAYQKLKQEVVIPYSQYNVIYPDIRGIAWGKIKYIVIVYSNYNNP